MSHSEHTLADDYARDGFVFPIDAIDSEQARAVFADLEAAETELAGDPERIALLHAYPDRLLPSFDALIRNPCLVAAAAEILGPDLLVWSAGLFSKDGNTPKVVSWHQDLTYWGLDDDQELTAWVALSPSTLESGCMRFVPASHARQLVAHVDTFDENNLLTRGQEIAEDINERDSVPVILDSGQASLHHGHLFHSSGPNRSNYRRIGSAIRYIKPSMKQRSGDRSLVALVSGEDRFGHFTIAAPPRKRLDPDDFECCREDSLIKRRVLYEGADIKKGNRYAS